MAVQIPDPGTGNGQTGDNEYVFRKKVKDNFSDQSNAASKLIGGSNGQVPLVEHLFKAVMSKNSDTMIATGSTGDCNNLEVGTSVYFPSINAMPGYLNTPKGFGMDYLTIVTFSVSNVSSKMQIAYSIDNANEIVYRSMNYSGVWQPWVAVSQTKATYTTTTASGANVVVDTDGKLMRSTSSERYKDILAPLELDDARYNDAMSLKPIVYRSTADADNPTYHYYSFSAEELGAYDPAFTLWRETEMVTDADGNVTEQPLAERQAEGININALLAMSHAIAIKQGKLIKALEHRLDILEAK